MKVLQELQDIVRTENYVKALGYKIENDLIDSIDVDIVGHFRNVTCLTIKCANIHPYCGRNNTRDLGYLIKLFVELFDKSNEDGVYLSDIKNIPCRLVMKYNRAYGIGNFMHDKFILFEELYKEV